MDLKDIHTLSFINTEIFIHFIYHVFSNEGALIKKLHALEKKLEETQGKFIDMTATEINLRLGNMA